MAEGERIYVRNEAGGLEPLKEKWFDTEDELQALLARHPELLEGTQINPDKPRRWILVTREQGIADTAGASARWSLDHLVIDQDACPTLVEVKRGANSEVRRTVVGQMLDYAAHAPKVWTADELRRTFEARDDHEERLADLLRDEAEEPDADEFWERVTANLDARRLRLLFVADAIPDELAAVVKFLNEQMPTIEVLAVEIKQFRGETLQTLVPRVIGRLEKIDRSASGSSPRRKLDREALLESLPDVARGAATRLLNAASECGARLKWGTSSVSIRVRCSTWAERNTPTSVCWIFLPGSSGPVPTNGEAFTFGNGDMGWEHIPDSIHTALEQWTGQLGEAGFMKDISTDWYHTWTVTYEDAAQHIDALEGYLRDILTKLKDL